MSETRGAHFEASVRLDPHSRLAGVLAPVTALRGSGDVGVGDVQALVEFGRWAAGMGFGLVQILPVNETGGDHSPYNIISSMALDPLTIAVTPEWLPDILAADLDAILPKHDAAALRVGPVKYQAVAALKDEVLRAAFRRFRGRNGNRARVRQFSEFEAAQSGWLGSYSRYRALVAWNGTEVRDAWPEAHRSPSAAAEWERTLAAPAKRRFRDMVRYYAYIQWIAFSQWSRVRAEFDSLGVALMGDIPVGVSRHSADVWEQPEIFDPARSSGAPPEKVFKSDPFTERWGQNWGFPLYNWQAMSRDNFAWWRCRLAAACGMFHLLRVDHALGFFRIYSFPWRPEENARFTHLTHDEAASITGGPLPGFVERDDSTEENRERNRAQGDLLLRMFLEVTGPLRVVAEDLGEVAPYVRPTLRALGIPGFKIPQWERHEDGRMVAGADYERLSLATFATHDHPPLRTLWTEADHGLRWDLWRFCGADGEPPEDFTPEAHAVLIRGLLACNSWLAVNQITDVLGLADRFNIPGAVGDQNWTTRVPGLPGDWKALYSRELQAAASAIRDTGRGPGVPA